MSRYIQELSKNIGGCVLKVREIIKMIETDGWYLVAQRGVIANTSIR